MTNTILVVFKYAINSLVLVVIMLISYALVVNLTTVQRKAIIVCQITCAFSLNKY